MRRSAWGSVALLVAVGLSAAACGGGGSPNGSKVLTATGVAPGRPGPSRVSGAAAAEQAFALDLVRQLGTGNGNLVVSPSSLDTALVMLVQGAHGQTAAELLAALHGQALGGSGLGAGWGGAVRQAQQSAAADHQIISEADQLWGQRSLPVRPPFLQALAANFSAGMAETDFSGDPAAAADAINEWVTKHTAGRIRQLFDAADLVKAQFVLADAVYLHASWAQSFDPSDTSPGPWYLAPGRSEQVQTMRRANGSYLATVTPGLTAAELPYRGGHLAALALMPPVGQLASFEQHLTPSGLARIVGGLQQGTVDLSVPKFHLQSTLDLNETLQALGVRDVFTDAADLSGISTDPLRVSLVKQVADIAVDEQGTTAAAATGVAAVTSAPAPSLRPVHLDHPFLLLLRDTTTGAILFAAEVIDPAAT